MTLIAGQICHIDDLEKDPIDPLYYYAGSERGASS